MAHLGNTVVNGALRVLGGENVDTINGVTVGNSPKFTDASVTASGNHYTPATASGQDKTASASGATAAWSIDVVKGVTLNTDGKGHVTGISVTSGKIPANPIPSNNVTGSGTSGYLVKFNGANTITSGPQLGSSTTTYLRNDGNWATPTDTNTHRPIQVNGTEVLGNNTTALNLKAGSNVSLSNSSGTVTIAATDTNTTYSFSSGDSNGQIKVGPSSGSAYNVAVKGLGTAAFVGVGTGVMAVGKESSRSTSTVGTWTAMCNSSQTGSPTLPSTGAWWNVINLNNWTDGSTNWISQLAITTQQTPTGGVWWRCNDSGGTDISSSTWHRCIDDTIMSTHGGFFAVGGGNDVSGDGTLYYSRVDVASADQTVGIQVSPYTGMFYGWQATRSTGVNNYGVYWYSCNGSTSTTKDCNAIADNGVFYYNANGPSHGFQSTDGALYAQFHSTPWGAEIAQDYRDGDLCVRGKNGGTWTAWRPIPAGLTYSNGDINTGHSRNCNDWSNSSGFFYFLSGGPDALSGFKAPDSSGTAFCHNYSSNSWANMWAQDFYNDGAMYVRSNAGSTWGAWQRLIDSSQIGTARIDRTDNAASFLQIKLNYGDDCLNTGMFTFKVTLYDAYVMRIYQISGYCYGGNHWYSPRAVKLAQAGTYGNVTNNYTNDTIYFRYDSNHNLYVYIRQEDYAGALISDVCNGYNHITNLNKIFSLSYVSSYDSTTAQGSVDLVGTGSYDLQDYSAFVGKSRTPTTAGTITLHTYGKIKQLTIWGTTWAATSGAAQLVLSITMTSNLCPTTNVEIMGHDDNGAAVFGYITNTGGVFIANRNAVPVYITATYI